MIGLAYSVRHIAEVPNPIQWLRRPDVRTLHAKTIFIVSVLAVVRAAL